MGLLINGKEEVKKKKKEEEESFSLRLKKGMTNKDSFISFFLVKEKSGIFLTEKKGEKKCEKKKEEEEEEEKCKRERRENAAHELTVLSPIGSTMQCK